MNWTPQSYDMITNKQIDKIGLFNHFFHCVLDLPGIKNQQGCTISFLFFNHCTDLSKYKEPCFASLEHSLWSSYLWVVSHCRDLNVMFFLCFQHGNKKSFHSKNTRQDNLERKSTSEKGFLRTPPCWQVNLGSQMPKFFVPSIQQDVVEILGP